MSSQRYQTLFNREQQLNQIFLNPTLILDTAGLLDSTAISTIDNQDRIRAYLLLFHAELESYFEDRIREAIDVAFSRYMTQHNISNVLVSCLVSPTAQKLKSDNLQQGALTELTYLGKLRKRFQHEIGSNNGVKRTNLCNLLLSIGIDGEKNHTTLMTELDNFGQSRGIVAHNSAAIPQTVQIMNPVDEQMKAQNILTELCSLDQAIDNL